VVTVLVISILFLGSLLLAFLVNYCPRKPAEAETPFYFGVCFGGTTIQEAETLIDRIKGFTNLFVMQSGTFVGNTDAILEIGDYAVSNNLSYAIMGDVDKDYNGDSGIDYNQYFFRYRGWIESWIDTVKERWGNRFLGLYYGDEFGGKMLDRDFELCFPGCEVNATVLKDGSIYVEFIDSTRAYYYPNGDVLVIIVDIGTVMNGRLTVYYPNETLIEIENVPEPTEETKKTFPEGTQFMWLGYGHNITLVNYYANGEVTVKNGTERILYTPENGSVVISQFDSYSTVLEKNPLKNMDEAAQKFVTCNIENLEWLTNKDVTLFTSDYGLYWWDYLSGYDFVLAQLGWNNTAAQEIALVRGAANMQNKCWGTIITWTYQNAPYLANADQIYDQMRMSYECGAEYVLVFNYAPDMNGTYGILQEDHLDAMEKFWTDVVKNPEIKHASTAAESVLVLPKNYGWGMRTSEDKFWGIWAADDKSEQIWLLSRSLLDEYGYRLDIVYEDPAFILPDCYSNVFYWNQTG
jgi:hypothetical protein